ncbi:MAG: DUF3999 domain-containing protein [Verrucomicrobiales bacterium]|nr:DUF3999 domain-containing protein [Verrucomicrobiales bacterium]
MKPPFTALLTFLFAAGAHAEAVPSPLFEFQRSLRGEAAEESLGVALLDADVFREARSDLSDFRLFDTSGETPQLVPFLIQEMEPEAKASPSRIIPSKIIDFSEAKNGAITLIVELENHAGRAASVTISTPLRNFEKQVSVEGSNDRSAWENVVEKEAVFDFEKYVDFRRTTIPLPENPFRFFRIRISEASDEMRSRVRAVRKSVSDRLGTTVEESFEIETRPFRVENLIFSTAKTSVEERIGNIVSYPASLLGTKINKEKKRSEILLDIENCPVDTLWFETKDRNFRRQVELQVPAGTAPAATVEGVDSWRTAKRGTIYHFQLGEYSDSDPEIEFTLPAGKKRPRWIRVLIENGDSPPVTISDVKAFGKVYQLRFLASPGETYVSRFGSNDTELKAPQFDLAAIRMANQKGLEKTRFYFNEIEANPSFSGSAPAKPVLNQTWMLWIAIAAVVACLIFVLVRAGAKIQDLE